MENLNRQIGENLQRIRKEKRLTIDALSSGSGVSKSMISEIERGIRNPSVTILWNIANSLKVPLNYFLKVDKQNTPIIYKLTSSEIVQGEGCVFYPLSNFNEDKKMEIYYREFQPGSVTESSVHYDGVEEYVLVSAGALTAIISEEEYIVSEGEVLHFIANQTHNYINKSKDIVRAFTLMFYSE